jgi:hypothetical protein
MSAPIESFHFATVLLMQIALFFAFCMAEKWLAAREMSVSAGRLHGSGFTPHLPCPGFLNFGGSLFKKPLKILNGRQFAK